jgi:hypothetical protein
MHPRLLACAALSVGLSAAPPSAWAQATKDQARLVFTVSGGAVIGRNLWSIGAQPVQFVSPADTVSLQRQIRSNIAIGFGGAYFPGENLGIAVEGMLLGIGFEDDCEMVFSSGSPDVIAACTSIKGASKSATAVALSAGPIFRVNSRSLFTPYARANLGLVFSNQSSIRTVGRFPVPEPPGFSELVIYDDDHESRVAPVLGLGIGFTAAVAKGYQLRWEVRDNIAGVQRVTAATAQARTIPPHKMTYKHLFSLMIGFDVVLERRPGRRY